MCTARPLSFHYMLPRPSPPAKMVMIPIRVIALAFDSVSVLYYHSLSTQTSLITEKTFKEVIASFFFFAFKFTCNFVQVILIYLTIFSTIFQSCSVFILWGCPWAWSVICWYGSGYVLYH
jgi:hypothetical protein